MTTLALRSDFESSKPLRLHASKKIDVNLGNSRTRDELEIERQIKDIKSIMSSVLICERLYKNLGVLYEEMEHLLKKRDLIANSPFIKRLFNRKKLREIDCKIDDLDYKIYLIESEPSDILIRITEQKLKKYDSFLKSL